MIIAIDYSSAIARSFVSSKVSETNAEYGWQVYTEERVASLSKSGSGDGHPAASAPESGRRPLNGGPWKARWSIPRRLIFVGLLFLERGCLALIRPNQRAKFL